MQESGIKALERATYADVWELEKYQGGTSPGACSVPVFAEFAQPGQTVLDAGCGGGKGSDALAAAGFHVAMCDLTDVGVRDRPVRGDQCFVQASLWNDLRPVAYLARVAWPDSTGCPFDGKTFDWVYSCDVLEHLPTQMTMLAVDQMLRVAKHGVFITLSTQPDNLGVWVGRPLHQTVQGFAWWRDSFRELGELVDARDLVAMGLFVLKGRAA